MAAVLKQDDGMDFSTIIASSVHDMKNSLSMLLSTLDEVGMTCGGAACQSTDKFSQLQYEGQRLNNNLIQLLSIYKIENAQYNANIAEYGVADFLEECAVQYETLLAPKGISIEFQSSPDLVGYFDRELIGGVINNVVNNAYRYSKDRIRLTAAEQDGYVVISVEDNGRGYPPHMLCDDATQLGAINFRNGSTGLGLYFAALVAKLHRNKDKVGRIRYSNDGIDGGGRFTIWLP